MTLTCFHIMSTVNLVHVTPDAEKLIVRMARVSNPNNQENWETGPKLLKYLIQHQHWSPFEMVSMCVEIETERDIAAQILRHRSFSFQEYSTRYAGACGAVVPAIRRQDETNRQNSIDDLPGDVAATLKGRIAHHYNESALLYHEMLKAGVAKECARRVLPLSTGTRMYMHGTARSWLHYIQVRTDPGTQLEHREVALQCKDIFVKHFPSIAAALF